MEPQSYPALFRSADAASNGKQRLYLRLIALEFGLLFLASVVSVQEFIGILAHLGYAAIFFALIIVLLVRALMKPQQDWYRARALAESVKTLSWRYMMRAEPFTGKAEDALAKAELRNHLNRILTQDRATTERLVSDACGDDQITTEMTRVRALDLDRRRALYASERVDEQRAWYANKASGNKKAVKVWIAVGIAAYMLAALLVLGRLTFTEWNFWPIEPVIVFAASVVGWTQLKKYGELSAAYGVTAHEIGLIRIDIDGANTEEKLSEFINDAERAFSREHTLWLARQTD